MTSYVILRNNDGEEKRDEWVEVARVSEASSARRALAAANLGMGMYVAIPARSWRPLPVTVEQKTVVTVG